MKKFLQNKTKMNETVRFQVDEKELEEIFKEFRGDSNE